MPPNLPFQTAQGAASLGDVVTKLDGISRQIGALIQVLQNRITYGTFTLAAAATTVVAQPAVKANSNIDWTPTDASAATLVGSAKNLYLSAINPGVGFTVATANASAAAGTETFQYTISNPQ